MVSSVTPARAQGPASDNVAKLEFQHADVREAIRDLFKGSGKSFTIDPQVQGPVTISLRNVAFDSALANVVRQVDATYRVEGGTYAIVTQGQGGGGGFGGPGAGGLGGGGFGGGQGGGFGGFQGGPPMGAGEPPVMTASGGFLFVLRRGTMYKINTDSMKIVGQLVMPGGPGEPDRRPGPPGGGGFGGGGQP